MISVREILLATSFVLSVPTQGQPSDWVNVGPIQSGDVTAFVDYQVKTSIPSGDIQDGAEQPTGPISYRHSAEPLWVNIQRQGLTPTDHVFVQVIVYAESCYRGDCTEVQRISEGDLDYAELGRFTRQLSPVVLDYQLNDGYALSRFKVMRSEIVIWINSKLYKGADGRNLQLPMPLSH